MISPGYNIFTIAGSTWILGAGIALLLFVSSCLIINWKRFLALFNSYFLHKGDYNYKEICQKYFRLINSIQDRRSLYHTILRAICEIIDAQEASLLLKDNGDFTIKESFGSKPASFQVGDISDFLKWLTEYGRTVSRYDLVNRKNFTRIKGDGLQYCVQFHAEACVPLFADGKLFGVINIGARQNNAFYDTKTMELLDVLAGQSSVAIHNASLYEDIVRRNVKLQEVDRLKSQLLSNVSHEFRTPLNSIIGLGELMHDGGDGLINPEQKEHLKMVISSSKRLLDTVSAMVDLAKLEANHLSLNVRRINLAKLVAKVIDGAKPNGGTTLKIGFNGETPQIYGDEMWLNKLFSHVISNAVKYTPSGEILVSAERAGEMLKVGIHDTGVGISHDKQRKIFDTFSQASEGVDRDYEGSGVGLAISKKVVELHGGRIWLSSSPGKGSHFFFTLPLKPTTVKSVELE